MGSQSGHPTDHHGLINQYHARNVTVIKDELKRFQDIVIKPKLITMLKGVAQRMIEEIEAAFQPIGNGCYHRHGGNDFYPVWCGEMHDATGVAIYDDGVTISYLPAQKHDNCGGQKDPPYERIIGTEWLKDAIADGIKHFSKGLWIVVYSSVPYANKVNLKGSPKDRGIGYFDKLAELTYMDIVNGLQAIKI